MTNMNDSDQKKERDLSFHQERMWFIEKFERGKLYEASPIYHNIPVLIKFSGAVDVESMEDSIRELLCRHKVLRTKIVDKGDKAYQEIVPADNVKIDFESRKLEICHESSVERRLELSMEIAFEASYIPFDFGQDIFFRALHVDAGSDLSLIVLISHHCVIDRYSQNIFVKDLIDIYEKMISGEKPELSPPNHQYIDYVEWQNGLSDDQMEPLFLYWRSKLGSSIPAIQLPLSKPRPPIQVYKILNHRFSIDEGVAKSILQYCDRNEISPRSFLFAVYAHLLAIYGSNLELMIGAYVNPRGGALDDLVGPLENLVPIKCELSMADTVGEYLGDIDNLLSEADEYGQIPYEVLSQKFHDEKDMGRTALFDVLFHYIDQETFYSGQLGYDVEVVETYVGYGKYDVNLLVHKNSDALEVSLSLNSDVFSSSFLNQFKTHLISLAQSYLSNLDKPLRLIGPLTEEDKQCQLNEFNALEGNYNAGKNIGQILSEVFDVYADKKALSCGGLSISYKELQRDSDRLANHLLSQGITPSSVIGVALEPSIELITTIVAIIKVGGIYFPLDYSLPEQRVRYCVADSKACLILTHSNIADEKLNDIDCKIISVDSAAEEISKQSDVLEPCSVSPEYGLYIIYTSGSTGMPKGVLLTHKNLLRLLMFDNSRFGFDDKDVWLLFHSSSFDFSIWEIFGAILYGGTLVMVRREERTDYSRVSDLIAEEGVTVLNQTPPSFAMLAKYLVRKGRESVRLRYVVLGGGAFYLDTVKEWLGCFSDVKLINMYGITETCVHVTYHQVSRKEKYFNSYIGRPFVSTQVYILDSDMQMLPVGVIGEVYVGGDGLASCYVNKPALTAERFVPNPFGTISGGRLYRSGDLAKYDEDGSIIYIGRMDGQVKIRGYRIELGEIEKALLSDERVESCAVSVYKSKEGGDSLVAFVEPKPESLMGVASQTDGVHSWQSVFETYYEHDEESISPQFDISGWLSSYTLAEIDEEEMEDWVKGTVTSIMQLRPQKVLEIGCGTGLLLSRIAPGTLVYDATDFSSAAVEKINRLKNDSDELSHVKAYCMDAKESPETGELYDTVIINSVIQYFPSSEYLLEVIDQALNMVEPGGRIFIGDVRNLALLKTFHASVLAYQTKNDLRKKDFEYLLNHAMKSDSELLLHPDFFKLFAKSDQSLSEVEIRTKINRYHNEMSLFRYDAVLHVSTSKPVVEQSSRRGVEWRNWNDEWGLESIKCYASKNRGTLALRRVANSRFQLDNLILQWLDNPKDTSSLAEVKEGHLKEKLKAGLNPYEIDALGKELGFYVNIWESSEGNGNFFDVVLSKNPVSFDICKQNIDVPPVGESLASAPLTAAYFKGFANEIKRTLLDSIPVYAVPEKILITDKLQLTNNNKIAFDELPDPNLLSRSRETFLAPRNELQSKLLNIWVSLLGTDNISINDDFFSLGGHSLLATKLVHKVYDDFGVELPLRSIFENPTIEGLSSVVERSDSIKTNDSFNKDDGGVYPASSTQARFWLLSKLGGTQQAYNVPIAFKINGEFNLSAFCESFEFLVNRHDIFRTRFSIEDSQVVQVIDKPKKIGGSLINYRQLKDVKEDEAGCEEIVDLIDQAVDSRFDLENGPLFKMSIIGLAPDSYVVVLTMHHIITDHWSLNILIDELFSAYTFYSQGQQPKNMPPVALEYRDFIRVQTEKLSSNELSEQKSYWLNKLANAPKVLRIGNKGERDVSEKDSDGSSDSRRPSQTQLFTLSGDSLNKLAQDTHTSLYATLLTIYYLVLSKYSGQNEIVIGTPIANRHTPQSAGVVGPLVNSLPMRIDSTKTASVRDLMQQVYSLSRDLQYNQDIPLEWIVENLKNDSNNERSPLFEVMFVLQNVPDVSTSMQGVNIESIVVKTKAPKMDLLLAIQETDDGLKCGFEYDTSLFSDEYVKHIISQFCLVTERLCADVDCNVRDLSLFDDVLIRRYTNLLHSSDEGMESYAPIIRYFEQAVEACPDSTALVYDGSSLTYRSLNNYANQLANQLIKQGIKRGRVVAISMNRSIDMVVSVLAISKAGAAYLPIEPDIPVDRITHMLSKSGVELIIVSGDPSENVSQAGKSIRIFDYQSWFGSMDVSPTVASIGNPGVDVIEYDLAYVIYTSGSTGMPKGVMSTHSGLHNRLLWMKDAYNVTSADNILFKTPYSFDVSVWEIYLPLISGATLVIGPPKIEKDPLGISRLINKEGVTLLHFVPSLLSVFCQLTDIHEYPSLRHIVCSGEALAMSLVRPLIDSDIPKLHNLYGPTEASIDVSAWQSRSSKLAVAPIGKPISNVKLEVLADYERAPLGAQGELFIAGDCLALGYIGDPRQTAEKFLPHPYPTVPGERIYATGDLVRITEEDELAFAGRKDRQIKVRGMRIEPGEIEQSFLRYTSIKDIAVDCGDDGELGICAVTDGDGVESKQLLAAMEERLPSHMLPRRIVFVDSIPRLISGKVDRNKVRSLLSKDEQKTGAERNLHKQTHSLSDIESVIYSAWAEVLTHNQFSIDDNFFDVGGNSLLISLVHTKLVKELDESLELFDLFKYTTIRALTYHISGHTMTQSGSASLPAVHNTDSSANTDLAIIGIASRIANTSDYREFWDALLEGKEFVRELSEEDLLNAGVSLDEIGNERYVRFANTLEDVDQFDAKFFNILPREAIETDPQYRVLLECVYQALEDASYPVSKELNIGVFAGIGPNVYGMERIFSSHEMHQDFAYFLNNSPGFTATKLAYQLNLKGPAITVDTACSTFLSALHMAKASILNGDCDLVVVAAARVNNLYGRGYQYVEGGVNSADGKCRPFDNSASGTISGDGGGAIVIRRLGDALRHGNYVHGVIKGSAINNDGRDKVGFTAPSIYGQSVVLEKAVKDAAVPKESIRYIEAHGTGTSLGDPIEMQALKSVYHGNHIPQGNCVVGSVKSNLGHLDVAAGFASIVKAVGVAKSGMVPPTLHFQEINHEIDLRESAFRISSQLIKLDKSDEPIRVGVSSFGIGGTNAHVILEEPPAYTPTCEDRNSYLLVLSARSEEALLDRIKHLRKKMINTDFSLADIAYTLQVGREHFEHRFALICTDKQEAGELLSSALETYANGGDVANGEERFYWFSDSREKRFSSVSFVYPGQGEEYVNMFVELYKEEPYLREEFLRCRDIVESNYGYDIETLLFPQDESINSIGTTGSTERNTDLVHPILFSMEYALSKLWISWGIMPRSIMGHSLGEYVGATIAGVFSLEDALLLVVNRGRLLKKTQRGQMVAIFSEVGNIQPLLTSGVAIAANNSETIQVVSGEYQEIEAIKAGLEERAISYKQVSTVNGFHSPLVDAITDEYREITSKVQISKPRLSIISTVTGQILKPDEAMGEDYWISQLRAPVEFSKGIKALTAGGENIVVEMGPNSTLATLATLNGIDVQRVVSIDKKNKDKDTANKQIYSALANIWLKGIEINWESFNSHHPVKRVPLPAYPFQRERFWTDVSNANLAKLDKQAVNDWLYELSWRQIRLHKRCYEDVFEENCLWIVFLDEMGLSDALLDTLTQKNQQIFCVSKNSENKNARASHIIESAGAVDSGGSNNYKSLFADVEASNCKKIKIVHCWLFCEESNPYVSNDSSQPTTDIGCGDTLLDDHLENGFHSLVTIHKELEILNKDVPVEMAVVLNNVQDVLGCEKLYPGKAAALGVCKVVPQENPNWSCTAIDFDSVDAINVTSKYSTEHIFKEFSAHFPDACVAYRGGRRWIQDYQKVELTQVRGVWESKPSKKQDSILITGGLGGIGVEVAKSFAHQGVEKLVIIGRTELPERESWEAIKRDASKDSVIAAKISAVLDMEALGTDVDYICADIADYNEVKQKLGNNISSITGIVHAAGSYSVGLTKMKSREKIEDVLSVKIGGYQTLEQLFSSSHLDFVALFSSMATLIGGIGQADYCAANVVLDYFSRENKFQSDTNVLAINWDTWTEAGMAVSVGVYGMKPVGAEGHEHTVGIRTKEGIDLFNALLQTELNQVVVSTILIDERLKLSALLKEHSSDVLASTPGSDYDELKSRLKDPTLNLEQKIALIWKNVLGHESIDVDDNFFSLGGTSLLGISLANRLQDLIKEVVDITIIYEAPTISRMAEYIHNKYKLDNQGYSREVLSNEKITKFRKLANIAEVKRFPERGSINRKSVFILSAPRSGSSLLRSMLAGYSKLAPLPELSLLSSDMLRGTGRSGAQDDLTGFDAHLEFIVHVKQCDLPEARKLFSSFLDQDMLTVDFYHEVQAWCGDRMLVDKSPAYSYSLDTLNYIDQNFRDAFYIYFLRNPNGMLLSYSEANTESAMDERLRTTMNLSKSELAELVWLNSNRNISDFLYEIAPRRKINIFYEDLVSNPEEVMKKLACHMGVDYEPELLIANESDVKRLPSGGDVDSSVVEEIKVCDYKDVSAESAIRWKDIYKKNFLSEQTLLMANSLGIDEVVLGEKSGNGIDNERKKLYLHLASLEGLSHAELDFLLTMQ